MFLIIEPPSWNPGSSSRERITGVRAADDVHRSRQQPCYDEPLVLGSPPKGFELIDLLLHPPGMRHLRSTSVPSVAIVGIV